MGARSKRIKRVRDSRELAALTAELAQLTKEIHDVSYSFGGPVFRSVELRKELNTVWFATPFTISRDSEPLQEANWQVASREFKAHSDGVHPLRFSHWGCGWYERLYVRRDAVGALRVLQGLLNRLESYPSLDDDLLSELEWKRDHPGTYAGECYCDDDDCPVPLRELPWVAGVNVPGYLPERDTERFETLDEAWDWLIDERERDCGEHEDASELQRQEVAERGSCSTLLETPGLHSDHDLGLVYWIKWDGDH